MHLRTPRGLPVANQITGIGGVFISSSNQQKLTQWYNEVLGVPVNEDGVNVLRWSESGPSEDAFSVFHVFDSNDDYLKPSRMPCMINFRVRDLDTFLSELRGKGVKVYPETQIEPYGKFGWVEDPDGNKIELWEPTS